MESIAREAVRVLYGLTESQMDALVFEPLMSWYHEEDGVLCFDVNLQLQQLVSEDPGVFAPYTEKDGVYTVTINTETSVVEDARYESALAGNG